MSTLIHTELLALRTVRTTWALVIGTVLLAGVLAGNSVLRAGEAGAASIGTSGALLAVLGAVGPGRFVALLLGVLAVTVDFRHGTATTRFLATPRRARVLAAKAATAAALSAAVAVAGLVLAVAIGVAAGAGRIWLINPDVVLRGLGLVLAYPLYALLGVGLGAVIGYQPLAVVLPLAWLLYLEDFALRFLPRATLPWSTGGVTAALGNSGTFADVLPMAVGGLALLGYALLAVGFGAVRLTRKDIT